MDNILIADICGLCNGCLGAIKTAISAKERCKNVSIFKEIVHNKNVNNMLAEKGIKMIETLDDAKSGETIIIRAHGEPPQTYKELLKRNINYIDCTCRNVKMLHETVKNYSDDGFKIIILGKYGKHSGVCHPEVVGTIGFCNSKPILIEDDDDVKNLSLDRNEKYFIVCQTTFNLEKVEKYFETIKEKFPDHNIEFLNSVCHAQKRINESSKQLAKVCDLMIVVGGKNSSNTKELFENIKQFCPAIFIENINEIENELKINNLKINSSTQIGLTAGASTMKEELFSLKTLLQKIIKENNNEN